MSRVPIYEGMRGRVDDAKERTRENRLAGLFHDRHEAVIHFAQHVQWIDGACAHFLHHPANQGGQQSGADAMTHDVADEHAALRVGKLQEVEEVSAQSRGRNVTMGKTQRARVARGATGKNRVTSIDE